MANNVTVFIYNPEINGDAVDVTGYCVSVSSSVSKFRSLDYYEPGSCTIVLNNFDRSFDPTNSSSYFYNYVKPKKRIIVDSPSGTIFSGLIDDWSFNFDISGESTVTINATEKHTLFVNQYLPAQTFPSELSGERIWRILHASTVQWPFGWGDTVIDYGTQLLDADTISDNTNVADYLKKIQVSEQGSLFIEGTDSLKFEDNSKTLTSSNSSVLFSDDLSTYVYNKENTNLIANSNFETDASGWTNGSNATISRSTLRAYPGSASLQVTSTTGPADYWANTTAFSPVVAGKTYIASGYAQSETYSTKVHIRIDWYNSSNNLISVSESDDFSVNSTSWTRAFISAVAPAGAVNAIVVLRNFSYASGSEKMFWDSVYLNDAYDSWNYDSIEVQYSTDLLYNDIQVNSWDGVSSSEAVVSDSITKYSLYSYSIDGVLYSDKQRLDNLANYLVSKYAYPTYRFSSLRVNIWPFSRSKQGALLEQINLNSFAKVRFKPNNIGNSIEQYVRIIGISHEITSGSHEVTYQLESIVNPSIVLDDIEFGKLDYYSLSL